MSSIGRYSEIPRESSSHFSTYGRGLRKMSCFDSHARVDNDELRVTKRTFSTSSLPRPGKSNNSHSFSATSNLFQVTRIPPEDVANQLTFIDLEIFAQIDLEELISCGWIKKNKQQIAPNIVAYTRRFNHVSYWVVEEILSHDTCRGRADVISYFVKVAKRLYELNNLHSLFAIISALRSASIYRLNHTWAVITKKDKQTVEKYVELFSDNDNWSKLREQMDLLRIPCIPYIGVYLTDLVYLSMANPSGTLKENVSANNIFRIVTTYQTESNYDHIARIYPLQAQLRSVRYIDELLKFVEDDNYKKSLQLEPPSSTNANSNKSPAKFIPGHKKTNSWGNKSKLSSSESNSTESLRNLIDDSILERSGDSVSDQNGSMIVDTEDQVDGSAVILEGCLRRKTLLKNGKKPAMGAWQKYWVQVWGSVLLFYTSKSLIGSDRSDFKMEPCKMKSTLNCQVQMADDSVHPDSFNLADPTTGTMYKFRAGSVSRALIWCRKIQDSQRKPNRQMNLIKFD